MADQKINPTDEEAEYYQYLERLRKSGVTNMYGAAPYLQNEFGLGRQESSEVLANWMHNYSQLKELYRW